MTNFLKVLCCLFCCCSAYSQVGDDIKVWSNDITLEWYDFKGPVPTGIDFKVASSNIQIVLLGEFHENQVPNLKVEAQFIKTKSWTITDEIETLDHEQIHFDIAELYARHIRKEFEQLRRRDISEPSAYEKVYFDFLKVNSERQRRFDHEAYSSKDKESQWKLEITQQLAELKIYEYFPEE